MHGRDESEIVFPGKPGASHLVTAGVAPVWRQCGFGYSELVLGFWGNCVSHLCCSNFCAVRSAINCKEHGEATVQSSTSVHSHSGSHLDTMVLYPEI